MKISCAFKANGLRQKEGQFFPQIYFLLPLLLFVSIAYGACANLSTSTTLVGDTTSTGGVCFNITAANVKLDCAGFSIVGSNTTDSRGVLSNQLNTTIINCNISNFSTGIYFNVAQNGTIKNSNVSSTSSFSGLRGVAAFITNGTNTLIEGSRFYMLGNGRALSFDTDSDGSIIGNSTIVSGSNVGIIILNSNITILNTSSFGSSSQTIAIYNADGASITNTTVISNSSQAIYMNGCTNTTISQSTFQGGTIGIYLSLSNSSTISETIISADSTLAALLIASSSNNLLANNTINGSGVEAVLFYETTMSKNFTFINNTLISASNNIVSINAQSYRNAFYWNNFTNTSSYYVLDINGSNYYNNSANGTNKGNFWYNVMNGSVAITGTTTTPWASMYYGSSGAGYPYNNSTSFSKFNCNFTNCADFAPIFYSPPPNETCNSSVSTSKTMIGNATINGATCYTITAPNVVLDCNGYNITGDGTASTNGIYTDQRNTTIKNCNISNFDIGVYINVGASDSKVRSTKVSAASYGFFVSTVNNTTIADSSGAAVAAAGIIFYFTSNNSIINSTGISTSSYGLYLYSSTNNTFSNATGISSTSRGIYLLSSNNNTLFNSTGFSTDDRGIYLYLSNNNTIANSTGDSTNNIGIIPESSNNNTFSDTVGRGSGSIGLYVLSSSGNTITNSTFISNAATFGLYFVGVSDNNTVRDSTAYSLSSSAMYIGGGSNILIDCQGRALIGTNSSGSYGVFSNQFNTTVKNCNISNFDAAVFFNGADNSTIEDSITATTNSDFGDPTYSSAIVLYNHGDYNTVRNTTATSTRGMGATIYASDYNLISNSTFYSKIERAIYLPYAIGNNMVRVTVTSDGFVPFFSIYSPRTTVSNSSIVATAQYDMLIYESPNTSIINTTTYSAVSHGIYIDTGSTNVTVDCQGASIRGEDGGGTVGVYSNQPNTTVRNCNVTKFNQGITLAANSNTIAGNNINLTFSTSDAYAIYLQSSSYNTVANNTIRSLIPYGYGLVLGGSSRNNVFCNNTLQPKNGQVSVYFDAPAGNNTLYWNNMSSGIRYVSDYNGTNFYNTTISGHGEGNIWENVINGSVQITGINFSLYGNGSTFYYGTGGTGYPYNNVTSLGNIFCYGTNGTGCVDYAPLTLTLGALNSCTYSGSGNWYINCADICNTTSDVNLNGNNIIVNNTVGRWNVQAKVYNFIWLFQTRPSSGKCWITIERSLGGRLSREG